MSVLIAVQILLTFFVNLERFMKCCKCIIIKAETGNYPTLGELKARYGHDIEQLHKALADDFEKYVSIKEELEFLRTDYLLIEMMHLLSEFACGARYYNLNFITQGHESNTLDIQSMWAKLEMKVCELNQIAVNDLSKDMSSSNNCFPQTHKRKL